MDNKLPIATHEGELPLGGRIIECAVLDDKTRILTASAVFKALDRPRKGKSSESYRADRMPSFMNANNLQPFVNEEIRGWTELVEYIGFDGKVKSGYNAKLLRGICKVYIDAKNAGALHSSQEKTAATCQDLLYALADRGIESLVDEATGFDKVKDKAKEGVQLFLERSLQLEPAKWTKTFSDDFFEMIFRLRKWKWNWTNTSKRPGVVGHYINDLVYSRIAPNVLSELQKLNPKKGKERANKHHQHLTRDYGHPILKEHLASLVAIGKVCNNDWEVYMDMVNRAFPKYGQTLELDFAINYNNQLEDKENRPDSDFDKKIDKALNWNPKNQKGS